MHRHNWTKQEDKSLRNVVAKMGCEDWTKNSEKLKQESQIAKVNNRSGKQCRQRWYNHLDPTIKKSGWTQQEEIKLFQAQKRFGNKWKQICSELPGRTDNDVKNRFYSTLRRSLRRLNKFIGEKNSTSQMREIKPSVLTYIIKIIYEQSNSANKDLLGELKELPELIFKFSTFKPIKTNMNSKIDGEMRDRITLILSLVEKFRNSCEGRKRKNVSSKGVKVEESLEDSQAFVKIEEDIGSASSLQPQIREDPSIEGSYFQQGNNRIDLTNPFTFTSLQTHPIPSRKSKQNQVNQHSNVKQHQNMLEINQEQSNNLFGEEQNGIMLGIEEPSISFHQQFLDLVVVGKHMEPIQWELGELEANNNFKQQQINEVFEENYS